MSTTQDVSNKIRFGSSDSASTKVLIVAAIEASVYPCIYLRVDKICILRENTDLTQVINPAIAGLLFAMNTIKNIAATVLGAIVAAIIIIVLINGAGLFLRYFIGTLINGVPMVDSLSYQIPFTIISIILGIVAAIYTTLNN